MDMSDMASMGGMDMGGEGPFRPTNVRIASGLWYGIVGAVGLLTIFRLLDILQSRQRQKLRLLDPSRVASRPQGYIPQAYATATATVRELLYPQPVYFTGAISKFFSPLPIGRWLIVVLYWTLLLGFLWSDTILKPSNPTYAYKWEKVGYRAAWVSVAQIPFIYLLSCKFNAISLLTGISYERFNWLHRWAARTVFLTIIVHWSFFFREWWLADFVTLEIQMIPMVKYGFGAWATIGWMILTGFGFFRNLSYEVFVAQHICAAATLLWLLHTHVPSYARYYVYMSIGFVAFDWSARIVWAVLRNTHILDRVRFKPIGYSVRLETLPGNMVRLTIDDPGFSWKAGQHTYISIPRLRPFELHPFTIANCSNANQDGGNARFTMVIKAHSGFSRRLHRAALDSTSSNRTYRAFLSGPWGFPPDLRHYESVVLVACSSGASFTVPLLHDLMKNPSCPRKIVLHWIIRSEDHLQWFERDLLHLFETAQPSTCSLQIHFHVTKPTQGHGSPPQIIRNKSVLGKMPQSDTKSETTSTSSSLDSLGNEQTSLSPILDCRDPLPTSTIVMRYGPRPSVESMIRPAVEAALGETAIVVCGGLSITAQARTFVASLSDERAVHKGTGAQGIFLHTETYGM